MAHAPLTIISTPRTRVFDLSRWYLWSTRYAARIRSRIAPELRTIAPSSNGGVFSLSVLLHLDILYSMSNAGHEG